MIKIQINRSSNNQITQIEIKGHANSAPYGKDLVCAAVSAVITGGMNNIHKPNDYELILEEGHSLIKANTAIDEHDAIVLETIVCGLKTIEESDPDYVKIKFIENNR